MNKENTKKNAENSLKSKMAFIESALNAVTDVFYAFDLSGKFLVWNKVFSKVTGYSDEELFSKKPTDFFSGEDVRRISEAVERIFKDGSSKQEANLVLKDGSHIPYEFTGSILRDGLGNIIGFSGTGRDLTERKKIEEELKKTTVTLELSKESFNSIVERSNNGIIITDLKGMAHYFNPTAKIMLTHKDKDFADDKFSIPVGSKKLIDIVRVHGGEGKGEVTAIPTTWSGKQSYLVEIYDITEINKAKEEIIKNKKELELQAWGLQKANDAIKSLYKEIETNNKKLHELNQVKTDFISTVSHELRTPLTTMNEFISIISDEIHGKLTKEQKEYVDIVKGNIDRLARLINNLLDISKIEAGKTELKKTLVDVISLANSVIYTLKSEAEGKHIELKASFPAAPVNVYADADKIVQIFINLIGNAIKFTKESGQIIIEVKDMAKEAECSVTDTGKGISSEDMGKLFGKFQQFDRTVGAGAKGTGLGLAITKGLVEMHNGRIWAESKIDKGSKFIFTLPKITAEEIFKEYIINGLKEAADRKSSLSLIVVHIAEFSQLQKKWGEKPLYLLTDIERVVKGSLRRKADTVLKSTGELAIPLPDIRKEDAEIVKKRIEEAVRTYLSQSKEEWIKEIHITLGTATYPEEVNNHQELLNKARGVEGGGTKYRRVKNNVKKNTNS